MSSNKTPQSKSSSKYSGKMHLSVQTENRRKTIVSGPRFIKALTKSGILEMSPMPTGMATLSKKTPSVTVGSSSKDEVAEESSLADVPPTGRFGNLQATKQDSLGGSPSDRTV